MQNFISINNLARLGIVELNHVFSLTDMSYYQSYKELVYYKKAEALFKQNPDKFNDVKLCTGIFSGTPVGLLFKSV